MPGTLLGGGVAGTTYPHKRSDRWLNFWYAWPPESNIRDREDSPGARNPYNPWVPGTTILGGEELGMWPLTIETFDDDIRFAGNKAGAKIISIQTVDSGGNPAPGITVELWLISVDWVDAHQPLLIGTTVSDANGNAGFAVPNTTNKYKIEAYDGSRGGVTVRNLSGA